MAIKVRAGQVWIYRPSSWDLVDPPYDVHPGDRVIVVKLPGCPPPGTMGHCHVNNANTGHFAGLVCLASLAKE
jgi:hypothetical protein